MRLKISKEIKIYGISFVAGIVGAAVMLFVSHAFKPQTMVASVDVNKIVSAYLEENKQNTQDETRLAIQTSRFMDALEKSMKSYSVKNKVTLVVSEAIITGAEDITPLIRRHMEERLNG